MTDTADLPERVQASSMDEGELLYAIPCETSGPSSITSIMVDTSPRLPIELLWHIMSWSEAVDLWRYIFINRDFEAYIVAHGDYELRCDVPLTQDLLKELKSDVSI
jgi:hypothetical protein